MKKIAIVGSHPATRDAAPWDDKNFNIWVFNEAPQSEWCKRADATFQMHLPVVYRNPFNMSNKEHWDWLQQPHDLTVWMQDSDPLVPASKQYPLDDICRTLLPGLHVEKEIPRYFTSTPAYALALAIYLNYDRIDIYGCEMESNTEYSY